MTVDFALNLVWLLIGASALVATRCGRMAAQPQRLSRFRLVSVVVVLAALFPYISAFDDTLQVGQIHVDTSRTARLDGASPVDSHATQLVWLFESLHDAATVSNASLAPHFSSSTIRMGPGPREVIRCAVPSNGRGPPIA